MPASFRKGAALRCIVLSVFHPCSSVATSLFEFWLRAKAALVRPRRPCPPFLDPVVQTPPCELPGACRCGESEPLPFLPDCPIMESIDTSLPPPVAIAAHG